MPNSSTAKKELRKSLRRKNFNRSSKSRVRAFIKKMDKMISSADKQGCLSSFDKTQSEIHKSVRKKVFKRNKASNVISSIARRIKLLCLKKQA